MYGYGYGFDWVGPIIGIIWLVVLIVLAVALLRWALAPRGRYRHWRHPWEEDRALSILKERYARGEINKEEFEEKRDILLR